MSLIYKYEFESIDQFTVKGRFKEFVIQCWQDCMHSDLDYLIGATVKIDGKEYKVKCLERFACNHYRTGLNFGILVEE